MAKHATAPKARLRFQLDDQVLIGMAGGQHVHCMAQCPSDPSAGAEIAHGVYQVMPPVENPVLGRVAMLTHLTETSTASQLGGRSSAGDSAYTYTIYHGPVHPALAGGLTYTRTHGSTPSHLAGRATSPRALILTKGPLGGASAIVVTTDFEQLMDLLEESGGGTLEITD
jgi:hypothetical protein